jgi:hypothetical protein
MDSESDTESVLLHDLTVPTSILGAFQPTISESNPDALFPIWDQTDKEEFCQAYYEIRNNQESSTTETKTLGMVAE